MIKIDTEVVERIIIALIFLTISLTFILKPEEEVKEEFGAPVGMLPSPSRKGINKNKTDKKSGYKKVNENDKAELYKLYSRAMKAMPGSPNQKKLKKQIAVLRKKLGMNEDLTPLRKIYMDLDKRFKNYDSNKTKDFNKVLKFLKSKLRPGSQIPAFIASFYNDYKGGEDIDKNQKRYSGEH